MEKARSQRGMHWLIFFASVIAFVLLYAYKGELVTLALPFVCTSFAKAMDLL